MADLNTKHISYEDLSTILLAQMTDNAKELAAIRKTASTAYHYKGTKASFAELPSEGMQVGDVYNIEAADKDHKINAGDNVAWNGSGWDNLAGVVDLSGYVEKDESARLMLIAEGEKLAGIEEGAQVNVIETVKVDGEALSVADKTVEIDLSGKVDVEEGKSLIADTEITRLDGMSDGANKTEVSVEAITAGTKVAAVTIDGTTTEIKVPTVVVTAEATAGVKVGSVKVGDGDAVDLYIPADDFATVDEMTALYATLKAQAAAAAAEE